SRPASSPRSCRRRWWPTCSAASPAPVRPSSSPSSSRPASNSSTRSSCRGSPPTRPTRWFRSCSPPCSIGPHQPNFSACCANHDGNPMTPNGAIALALIMIALVLAAPGPRGIAVLLVLAGGFAIFEVGRASLTALRRTAVMVLPLAAFMILVWVFIVGRPPSEIAADAPGTRAAAFAPVAGICARLFFVVAVIQLVSLRFADLTPLRFVQMLALPAVVKRQLVLTLSLIATLRHAIDRAHVALIAAGTLTRR